MSSVWTSESQIHDFGRRASSVSTFTIRQAVRRDTIKARAMKFSFPKKEDETSYIRLLTKFGLRRSKELTHSADQLAEGFHIDTSIPLSSQPSYPSPTPSTTTTLVRSSLYQNNSLPNTPTLRNPPLGQNGPQLHRQCAILDVESLIPEDHDDPSGLSPTATYQDSSPVPLSSILKLFRDLSNGRQLESGVVEDALMRFLAIEQMSVEDKGNDWDGETLDAALSG
ncbi:hypothetical protein I307_04617 [Cryptococcus deuterogattii 99/473]|uniref:Uncharacterized protein n=1 Tax=Cryptococcus deuterogattii Ram5 TaxID=1296110 RepID=A0A0D0V662_9TREE|nr:hypothetical protein I313_02222 [Cryptococcus deuterogattii Ram5]KIY55954.1 hypothetical protein I307_04617 [Cryptococcus deuterogattii 99/473]